MLFTYLIPMGCIMSIWQSLAWNNETYFGLGPALPCVAARRCRKIAMLVIYSSYTPFHFVLPSISVYIILCHLQPWVCRMYREKQQNTDLISE